MCFSTTDAWAQTPQVIAPSLGPYGRLDTYCGKGEIPKDPFSIPWIGCFYLSKGRLAIGDFLNHRVEVDVDTDGMEVFIVDNVTVATTRDPATHKLATNLPFVRVGGTEGYLICEEDNSNCARIEVFARNADKSVLFMVTECLPPAYHICVTTQSNWDYEMSRRH
jgi:hypothetical protein